MTSLCRHLSAQEIVNLVTTADGYVHTADATKQFRPVGVGGVYWALHCQLAMPSSKTEALYNVVLKKGTLLFCQELGQMLTDFNYSFSVAF